MRKRLIILAATLLTAFALRAQHPASILPYLQNPTADAVTISYLAQNARDVTVVLHRQTPQGLLGLRRQPAAATPIPGTPWTHWKARFTGLTPGQAYDYTIIYKQPDGSPASTEKYIFTHPDPQSPTLRAAVFNDLHDRIPTLEQLLAHITPADYDITLLNGDMWNDPSPKDGAERVFKTLEAYVRLLNASTKPLFYLRGNHDTRGSFANRLSHLFDLPNNDPAAPFQDQNAYYDFRIGPVWFICPDAGEDGNKRAEIFQPYRQRQASWLEGLFTGSASRTAPWRVAALHIPLYNSSWWDQPDALARWEPILSKARIDLMIAGHDHTWRHLEKGKTYTRTRKEKDGSTSSDSVTPPYPVLIGGGPAVAGGEIATVILLRADLHTLTARMINANGAETATLILNK